MGREAVKVLTRERDAVREMREIERSAPQGLLDLGGEGQRRKGPSGKEAGEGRERQTGRGGRRRRTASRAPLPARRSILECPGPPAGRA